MTVIGNFFLFIAVLCFLLIIHDTYFAHHRGGDAAIGHAYALVMVLFGFVACLSIVTILIGLQGGFSWVKDPGPQRFLLVLAGFGIAMLGAIFFLMGEGMGRLPKMVGYMLMCLGPIAMVSVLAGAFLLLNDSVRSQLPTLVWRLPIYIAISVGLMHVGLYVGQKVWDHVSIIMNRPAARESDIQERIAQIDATDLMKNGVFLYVFTDANHDKPVRERALARIKSRPDWQEELVRRLQNDRAPDAFTFLASNEVDDKAMLAGPVRQGILIQARLVREYIRSCRDKHCLRKSEFSWEVDRVLRTVDRFEGMGIDYRPAMQELRNALDEPSDFEVPKLMAKAPLDKWLKKH